MSSPRKFWLILGSSLLGLLALACSCSSLVPLQKTPTPFPTVSPVLLPTSLPDMSGLVGRWLDPDSSGDITTIIALGGGYVVDTVTSPGQDGNELTSTNWTNGVLSWTYCVPAKACVTMQTLSLAGDSLQTSWSNDLGQSGSATLTRYSLASEAIPGLAGKWLDPETLGTYHVIAWQDGKYVVTETANPSRVGNEVTSSEWDGSSLTWTYCVQDGACVTIVTDHLDGNNLYTDWRNDVGKSGSTVLQRLP
jgi:hypothetical protein